MDPDYQELQKLVIEAGQQTELEWSVAELIKKGVDPIDARTMTLDTFRPHIAPTFGTQPKRGKKRKEPTLPEPVVPPQRDPSEKVRPRSGSILDDIQWVYEHYDLPKVELAVAKKTATGGALSMLSQVKEDPAFRKMFFTTMLPKLVAAQKSVDDETKKKARSATILDMIERILGEAEADVSRARPANPAGEPDLSPVPAPAG